MKKIIISCFTILILLLSITLVITGIHKTAKPSESQTTKPLVSAKLPTRLELLALVNAERAKNGIALLSEDPRLDQSAQMKADDETLHGYYNHVSPITGRHGYEYINDVGVRCVSDSENIGQDYSDEQEISGWIKSVAHHQAMIDPRYSLTGFGISKTSAGFYNFVEHFCQQ